MSERGVTLIELIVVMGVMTLLLLMSLPAMIAWQRNAAFRDTARNIANVMRDARGRAINQGLPFQVVFEPGAGRYSLNEGGTTRAEYTFPPGLTMKVGDACNKTDNGTIEFFPNGCGVVQAGERTVCVLDPKGTIRFRISLEGVDATTKMSATCRIKIDR